MAVRDISRIPAVDKSSGAPNVIVETPKGGRTKFKYDEKLNLFKFDKALPFGHSFPFQFGFLTSTLGGDGDPLGPTGVVRRTRVCGLPCSRQAVGGTTGGA